MPDRSDSPVIRCRPPALPFDPPGDVLTTDRLEAYMDQGRPMLNNYTRYAKVGGGQHGEVYMCYKYDPKLPKGHPDRRIPVAMKSVRRDNPRAEQWKKLRQHRLPPSPHMPLADKLNTTEAKIRKEIAIMKKCRHPHVVRLYEVIDDRMRDKIYMVMEYLAGGEVKWRNDQHQPILSLDQTKRIMRDAVLGLEYLHHQGIIHRDIKPANLLWTEDRRQVKIADFGVSHFSYAQRLAGAGRDGDPDDPLDPLLLDDSDLTKRAGTPSFLAPEVVFEHTVESPPSPVFALPPEDGRSYSSHSTLKTPRDVHHIPDRPPITKAIDIWALGVTFYCLLFGKTPFVADGNNSEWSLYHAICNNDWAVDDSMGSNQVPTGGRHPIRENSTGAIILKLLGRFLEKDVKARITLEEVKSSPWLLRDLPDPDTWLRVTSPTKVSVSLDETSDAMSAVHFRWQWGQITRRISSLLRTVRPQRSRDRMPDSDDARGVSSSEPHPRIGRPKSGAVSPTQEPHAASLPGGVYRGDKGKWRAEPRGPVSKSSRSKSIERWPADKGHSSSTSAVSAPHAIPKARRGSETILVHQTQDESSQLDPTGSDRPRTRFAFFSMSHWRPNKYPSQGPSPSQTTAASSVDANLQAQALGPMSHVNRATRRSEEAFRHYRSGGGGTSHDGPLTAARRASSWGQGDQPAEFAEVASMKSVGRILNDHDMNVGAGGVSNGRALRIRTSSGAGSSAGSSAQAAPSLSTDEDQLYGPACYDEDSSTIASAFDNEDPLDWQTGSDLEDSDDPEEEDDDGVVFTPGRRARG